MTPLKKFMELPRTFLMLLARITIKMFQWLHKLTTCFILHHYRLIRLQGDFDQLALQQNVFLVTKKFVTKNPVFRH